MSSTEPSVIGEQPNTSAEMARLSADEFLAQIAVSLTQRQLARPAESPAGEGQANTTVGSDAEMESPGMEELGHHQAMSEGALPHSTESEWVSAIDENQRDRMEEDEVHHEDLIEVDEVSHRSNLLREGVNRVMYTQMAIDLYDLPAHLTIRVLLAAIRVPHGRIRVAAFSVSGRMARIVFADVAGHEAFMRGIYDGTLRLPHIESLNLKVIQETVPVPHGEEAWSEATRVLMMHGPPGEHKALQMVFDDLLRTSRGWRYDVEKAVLCDDGQGHTGKYVRISFGSIQDAVHAKRTLRTHPLVRLRYCGTRFSYGHDDCSTTNPFEHISMLEIRDLRVPPTTTTGFIVIPPHPHRTPLAPGLALGRPPTSTATHAPSVSSTSHHPRLPPSAPFLAPRGPRLPSEPSARASLPSLPTPTAGPQPSGALVDMTNVIPMPRDPPSEYEACLAVGRYPLPPFDCHRHGLFIHQIPHLITEAALLTAIHGGNVRRAFIFRPGVHLDGTAAHGAVFFNSQAVADAVLDRINERKGLMIPLARRRYRVTPYRTSEPSTDEWFPYDQTRILSLSISDRRGNVHVTPDHLRKYVRQKAHVMLTEAEIQLQSRYAGPGQRRFLFNLGSIKAATIIRTALMALPVEGEPPLVQFERDPCSGPVERMQ